MGLGIALGGFARGIEAGYGLGSNIQDDRRKRNNQNQLDAIDTQTKQDYEAAGGGMGGAGDFETFYTKYAVPKKIATLAQQGDLKGAEEYRAWAEDGNNRKGAILFGDGMIAGQAGDIKGAITKFIAAGKVKGYGGDYDISDAKELSGGGWSVNVTTADGAKHDLQFKTPDEVLNFGATYLNPEKAFDDWRAQQGEAAKSGRELATERAKLGMQTESDLERQSLGLGTKYSKSFGKQAAAPSAIDIRKQAIDELKDTQVYQEAPIDEQRKMLEDRINEITKAAGGSAASAEPPPAPRRVIVDTQTGAQIDPSAPTPQQAPAPAGAAPKERVATGLGRGGGSAKGRTPSKVQRPVIVNPGGDIVDANTGEHVGTAAQDAVVAAVEKLKAGAEPAVVRLALRTAKVPLSDWPEELKPAPRALSR